MAQQQQPDSRAVALHKNAQALNAQLRRGMDAMKSIAPSYLSPERVFKIVTFAASRNPSLLECTPQSILKGVMEAVELGLEPCSPLGHAYLVPFRNKNGTTEATMIPGYKGLVDLVIRAKAASKIDAQVVRQRDHFECSYGSDEGLYHRPDWWSDRGDIVGVYAIAHGDNWVKFEIMSVAEVEKIRARSRSGQSGPWVSDWEMMARKTVIKRLCKTLRMTVDDDAGKRLVKAIETDDRMETGDEEPEIFVDVENAHTIDIAEVERNASRDTQREDAWAAFKSEVEAIGGINEAKRALGISTRNLLTDAEKWDADALRRAVIALRAWKAKPKDQPSTANPQAQTSAASSPLRPREMILKRINNELPKFTDQEAHELLTILAGSSIDDSANPEFSTAIMLAKDGDYSGLKNLVAKCNPL